MRAASKFLLHTHSTSCLSDCLIQTDIGVQQAGRLSALCADSELLHVLMIARIRAKIEPAWGGKSVAFWQTPFQIGEDIKGSSANRATHPPVEPLAIF